MKALFSAIATLVLSCATLFAAPAVEPLENSQFKVSIGEVAMIVDAAQGGKILSFTYQGKEIMGWSQEEVERKYLTAYPEMAEKYSFYLCESADGIGAVL